MSLEEKIEERIITLESRMQSYNQTNKNITHAFDIQNKAFIDGQLFGLKEIQEWIKESVY